MKTYDLFVPKNIKGVISIPHSGEIIPNEFISYLTKDKNALGMDVDFQVNKLIDIDSLVASGVAVIIAKVHRACLDLNRTKNLSLLNWKKNTQGDQLVIKEPDEKTHNELVEKYYDPYYEQLTKLLSIVYDSNKKDVNFVDLHSMPSKATAFHLAQNPRQKIERPDFCISDLGGISTTQEMLKSITNSLGSYGYNPLINDPYNGGYITKFIHEYEIPTDNIQIEINRSIYMDEKLRSLVIEKSSKVKNVLTMSLKELFKL